MLEPFEAIPARLTRLGLLLTEFLTNALEHAFKGRDDGTIRIRFHKRADHGCRLMIEDDGIGLPEGSNWPWDSDPLQLPAEEQGERTYREVGRSGLGGTIISGLVSTLDGRLDVRSGKTGTIVCLDLEGNAAAD